MPEQTDIHPLFRDLLGSPIAAILAMAEICGEECARVGDVSSELWKLLRPGESFATIRHPGLYRAHVRELLERATAKPKPERLDYGTRAEVLIGLVHTSQAAPLNRGGSALYHDLFRSCLGEDVYRTTLGADFDPPRERWKGQTEELLHEARRKVRTGRPKRLEEPPLRRRARSIEDALRGRT